ncbi:MAG: isochorismatase family protein, partial [Pseudomonadota bacterium]
EGFLKKLDTARRDSVLSTMSFVVEVAGRLGIPTFVTVEMPDKHGPTATALMAQLPPGITEYTKNVFNLAAAPDLMAALQAQPRRTAVLIGLETDVCVLQSAVGLAQLGFRPVVIADATASPAPEHAFGLDRIRIFGFEVLRAKGLCYEWTRQVDTADALFGDGRVRAPAGIVL